MNENQKKWENGPYFFRVCVVFAAFFVFCLYDNFMGITYPLFMAGLLYVYLLFLKKEEISLKKESYFYMSAILLLSVSTCLTDNEMILVFNRLGIWLLLGILSLHNSYEDQNWKFTKYLGSLFLLCIGVIENIFSVFKQGKREVVPAEGVAEKEVTETRKNREKAKAVLLGMLIALPLLFVVLLLLSSADVVFNQLLSGIFQDLIVPEAIIQIPLMFVGGLLFFFSIFYTISRRKLNAEQKDRRTQEPLTGITFTSLIALIYYIFCAIQVVYLFIGGMELPEGYTYSAYARQGFFQLLFVCLLNIALVLFCLGLFKENRILKILLTVISACTYIMTASAFCRIFMYIGAYGLTRLRILVVAALVGIAILLAGVIRNIYRENFPLFRFGTVVVTCVYLLLALGNMDAWIARYNLTMRDSDTFYEHYYLFSLSADAAEVYADFLASGKELSEEEQESFDSYFRRIEAFSRTGIRSFNLSRFQGKKAADQYFENASPGNE